MMTTEVRLAKIPRTPHIVLKCVIQVIVRVLDGLDAGGMAGWMAGWTVGARIETNNNITMNSIL